MVMETKHTGFSPSFSESIEDEFFKLADAFEAKTTSTTKQEEDEGQESEHDEPTSYQQVSQMTLSGFERDQDTLKSLDLDSTAGTATLQKLMQKYAQPKVQKEPSTTLDKMFFPKRDNKK
jgi:hypothetical protein